MRAVGGWDGGAADIDEHAVERGVSPGEQGDAGVKAVIKSLMRRSRLVEVRSEVCLARVCSETRCETRLQKKQKNNFLFLLAGVTPALKARGVRTPDVKRPAPSLTLLNQRPYHQKRRPRKISSVTGPGHAPHQL